VHVGDLGNTNAIERGRKIGNSNVVPGQEHPVGLEPECISCDGSAGGTKSCEKAPAGEAQTVACSMSTSAWRLSWSR
jgi:hypothetical protein